VFTSGDLLDRVAEHGDLLAPLALGAGERDDVSHNRYSWLVTRGSGDTLSRPE
jgi:hypothetical protein